MFRLVVKMLAVGVLSSGLVQNSIAEEVSEEDKVFYYLGTALSQNLMNLSLSDSEAEAVVQGLRDSLNGNAEELNPQVYGARLNQVAQERMAAAAAKEQAAAQTYIDKKAAEKGAVTTASGLVYLETVAGDGDQPVATSTVKAHYTGKLRDGTVFDSSVERGEPLVIPLSNVIPCWTEAIAMMKEGGKATITCPSNIAYGPQGSGPIPPNAALTFDVELIEVVE